jgi:hypothetical protein
VSDAKYLDLDAAYEEADSAVEPLTVRLHGRDWELPGTVPAAVPLRLALWVEKGWIDPDDGVIDPDVPFEELAGLMRDMVPEAVFAEWTKLGLGIDRIPVLVERLMYAYNEVTRQGEARAPKGANRAARRSASRTSSNGGTSSKRTSTGSTRSRTSSKS